MVFSQSRASCPSWLVSKVSAAGPATQPPAAITFSYCSLRQASLPKTITVPWWGGRTFRYQYD